MKKQYIHSLLLIFLWSRLFGQNGITGNPEWLIKPAINQGFILEHRSTLGHLVKGYPTIYEVDIGKPTLGNKLWHLENNKPDIGLSFTVIDFKNPQQLGYSIALAPFADIPLNRNESRKTRLIMRVSWGVAYLNKAFDIHTNPKNIAIGSKVNSFVQFKWFWHIPINKNLRFEPGFAFSHASNARAKVPNLGLNVISLNAGLNYIIPRSKKTVVDKIDSSTKVKSKNELMAYASFGYNQREVATPYLFNLQMAFAYHRNVRNTHKFGIGTDVYVDQNYLIDYQQELQKPATGLDNFRTSLKFCYSYNIGRISFPAEIGYYIVQKVKPDGPVIFRLGVRYYGKHGFVAAIGLRTHFAVAYDFEYGIGYRFFL
ncbi:MAG: acyloxyacyl hydrolase [Bacteroidetes bacterium]|nr:acyloxyacyl hydrolase [Bacteroidota bacterium]